MSRPPSPISHRPSQSNKKKPFLRTFEFICFNKKISLSPSKEIGSKIYVYKKRAVYAGRYSLGGVRGAARAGHTQETLNEQKRKAHAVYCHCCRFFFFFLLHAAYPDYS